LAERRHNIEDTITEIEICREHLRAYKRGQAIPEAAQQRLERDLYRSYRSAMQRTGLELRRLNEEIEALDNLRALADSCGEPKPNALLSWLDGMHAQNGTANVIVFSEYPDTVDAIAAHLEGNGYLGKFVKLTGDIGSRRDRAAVLDRFSAPETLVLIATDVGGEGLNLHQHCNHTYAAAGGAQIRS
jgi:ERCC4-related helicase